MMYFQFVMVHVNKETTIIRLINIIYRLDMMLIQSKCAFEDTDKQIEVNS